jgi:hypothetical protein
LAHFHLLQPCFRHLQFLLNLLVCDLVLVIAIKIAI